MRKRRTKPLWACGVLLLAACQPTLPHYTVGALPHYEAVRPARSVVFVAGTVPPATDLGIEGKPQHLGGVEDRQMGGLQLHVDYQIDVARPTLRAVDGALEITATASGKVEASLGPLRCQSSDVQLVASVRGKPAVSEDRLTMTNVVVDKTGTTGKLSCTGVVLPLDLVLRAPLDGLAAGLRELFEHVRIPIGPLVRVVLGELGKPRAITIEDRAACIDLAPTALVLAPLGGSGDRLELRVGADVAPRVNLGACPSTPPAALGHLLVRTEPLSDRFAVDVAIAIAHEALQRLLAPALIGKQFGAHGKTITIDGVELGDAEGRVLVRVHVHGAFNGDIFLWGTPTLVERDGRFRIAVPDLHVALETRRVVERIQLALWQLLDGGLPAAVREKLDLDITDRVTALRAKVPASIERSFLSDHLQLTIEPHELTPAGVASAPGVVGLIVRIIASASATIH